MQQYRWRGEKFNSSSILWIFIEFLRSALALWRNYFWKRASLRKTICMHFRVRAAIIDHTVPGALFPPHTSRALGSATQGHARDRDSRAALRSPQDKRPIRQTYSGRSARIATRPESQAAPPHIQSPKRLSPPSHGSADRRLRLVICMPGCR
jgi:hypothetical protein